jgi:hypothetical protein
LNRAVHNGRMFDAVWQAVELGDWETARRLISNMPTADLTGGQGVALLHAAVRARSLPTVQDLLECGVDPYAPAAHDDSALSWAADHGDLELLDRVMDLDDLEERDAGRVTASKQEALKIAYGWVALDVEDELRRQLRLPAGGTVERDRVPYGDGWQESTRIRVTAPDGRSAQALTAHRAIITTLEPALGIVATGEELLERALHHGDPDSCDWNTALWALTHRRPMDEAYRWAITRIADARTPARRFVANALHILSMEGDEKDRSFAAAAISAIRDRLAVEDDPYTLEHLLAAYAEFHSVVPQPEIRAYARHPEPRIRSRAAALLAYAGPDPDSMISLVELTADPDADVRATALAVLSRDGAPTA